MNFFEVAKVIVTLILGEAALWWGLWALTAARAAAPLGFFPFGRAGYFLVAVSMVAAIAAALAALKGAFYREAVPAGPEEGRLGKKDALVLWLAGALILLFWEKALVRGWSPLNAMLFYLFIPQQTLAAEFIQRGLLPFWNPWGNAGMPLLADPQMGVFYPLNLPLFLMDFPQGFRVWLFAHMGLFFVFTYLWLRDQALEVLPAATGGFLVLFNGYVTWHAGYISNLAGLVWVPFLLHAWQKKAWPFVAMGAALQLLAGHPQFFYMTLLLLGAALLVQREHWKIWALTGLSLAGGFFLTAFQVLPSWELIRHSQRAGALAYETAVNYSQSVRQLLRFLLVPLWDWGKAAVEGDPYLTVFYIGPVALLLGLWGVVRKKGQGVLPSVWAGLGILLALGGNTPLYKGLFAVLPGFRFFRFPAQWMGLAVFGFAALAALGAARLPRKWGAAALVLMLGDFFLFNLRSPYVYVTPDFLHHPSPRLEAARSSGGRTMVTERLWQWFYEESPAQASPASFNTWLSAKESLSLSQGMAFHVPESFSHSNHTLKDVGALHLESFKSGPEGVTARRVLGVKHLADLADPAPLFRLEDVPVGWPRFRWLSGEAVDAETVFENPNALLLRLARPLEQDGLLVAGDAYFPGWRAFAGGQPRGIVKAQGAFRGVELKAGDRDILLRYDPGLFFLGFGAAFLFWAGLWGLLRMKKPEVPIWRRAGNVFFLIGGVLLLKALFDGILGRPYANLYSSQPWTFVTMKNWAYFCSAQGLCGVFNLGLGWFIRKGMKLSV